MRMKRLWEDYARATLLGVAAGVAVGMLLNLPGVMEWLSLPVTWGWAALIAVGLCLREIV